MEACVSFDTWLLEWEESVATKECMQAKGDDFRDETNKVRRWSAKMYHYFIICVRALSLRCVYHIFFASCARTLLYYM